MTSELKIGEGSGPDGTVYHTVVERKPVEISYDPVTDVLTFDGYRFAGDLMRTLTASPCGVTYRIVDRNDGVITVSMDRDPLAFAAPDLLEAARLLEAAEEAHANCDECDGEEIPELCEKCFPLFDDARLKRRAAIAKAEGRS